MVTFATSEGSLDIPDPLIRAIVHNAHRRADLTAATLDATGLFESEAPRLPAAFLLELSAVIELGVWERQGLRKYLNVDLPTYCEAAAELAARAQDGPAAFEGLKAASLSDRVLQVWVEHFAWDGPDLIGTEVVVGDFDDDDFVDLLAEFVWAHRHELTDFLQDGGTNSEKT